MTINDLADALNTLLEAGYPKDADVVVFDGPATDFKLVTAVTYGDELESEVRLFTD